MLLLKDEEDLAEFNQIETYVQALLSRQTVLASYLERRTQPKIEVRAQCQKDRGFSYRGQFVPCRKMIQMYVGVLRKLWLEFPDQREAMAGAMATCGYSRKYVARSRDLLFDGFKSPGWVRRYSAELVDGWYVDSNMSNRDFMQRVIKQAAKVAGLKWGEDIQVVWSN